MTDERIDWLNDRQACWDHVDAQRGCTDMTVIDGTDLLAYFGTLCISSDEQKLAEKCQQRTKEWHGWRGDAEVHPVDGRQQVLNRCTSSTQGALLGLVEQNPPDVALNKMLWPQLHPRTSNDAMKYGTQLEPWALDLLKIRVREIACSSCQTDELHVSFRETGTRIPRCLPWLIGSPDGLVDIHHKVTGKRLFGANVENKCTVNGKPYDKVKLEHQVQYSTATALQANDHILYNVYLREPQLSQHTEFVAMEWIWWVDRVLLALYRLYFHQYLPLAILKWRGVLPSGSIVFPQHCHVDDSYWEALDEFVPVQGREIERADLDPIDRRLGVKIRKAISEQNRQ